ncbi:hypothetical protein TTHERM_000225739 (macronuclear) [Tetrahymena thermophila SB210]|uniref:Transmembrane protein n=1 Tax=Tetrahymena thermophila (strain SB210) TaxID=312017 RepID=W7XK89_TETTS|nr:hypothetical protein TTHERM_000225739 [Tetrahymena thermophila SB210]EWS74719.1 hypothetical protein TTHERM_000225739 [Tetrahymena thermophila SB210]|eukprot:XP_012652720.1 hypothetical protein TTHERM_000225739 [Tetrahymena thermophila SB210]
MQKFQCFLLIFIFLLINSCSASWECITQYGCSVQYNKAKQMRPTIVQYCNKQCKAGTNKFTDGQYLDCLQTVGFEYVEIRNLMFCDVNRCASVKEEEQ